MCLCSACVSQLFSACYLMCRFSACVSQLFVCPLGYDNSILFYVVLTARLFSCELYLLFHHAFSRVLFLLESHSRWRLAQA